MSRWAKICFLGAGVILAPALLLILISLSDSDKTIREAKEAVLRENLLRTRAAIRQFHQDRGTYPAGLKALVEMRYLRSVPFDPIAQTDEAWLLVMAPECEAACGVVDLRSGAPGQAFDGSYYENW